MVGMCYDSGMTEKTYKLVVDVATKRPGCVLLQAGCGGDNHLVSALFDPEDWVLAPTEKMGMVEGTREQWTRHAELLRLRRNTKDDPDVA